MISRRTVCVTALWLTSIITLMLGSLLVLWTPDFLAMQLRAVLPIISDSSIIFNVWQDPGSQDIRIRRQFWVFSILNPYDICRGARPLLQRRGPYVYERNRVRSKDSISWIGKSIVSYHYGDEYIFLPNESIDHLTGEQLHENDYITVYSIGYLSTAYRLTKLRVTLGGTRLNIRALSGPVTNSLVTCYSRDPSDAALMQKIMVKDFIWGEKPDPYLKKVREMVNALSLDIYVPLHIRLQHQASIPAPFTIHRRNPDRTRKLAGKMCPIVDDLSECPTSSNSNSGSYTGISNAKDTGKMYMFNGITKLTWWDAGVCTSFRDSTDGMQHRPGIDRNENIFIFVDAIGRPIEFRYEGDSRVLGIDGLRYVLTDEMFESKDTNPDNACYYQNWQGFLNLTSVFFFPIYLSKPFFMDVHDKSRMQFDSWHETAFATSEQDRIYWDSYIDVNPKTGSPLQHSVTFQANLHVRPSQLGMDVGSRVIETVVPFLLVQDWTVISKKAAAPFYELIRPALRAGRRIGCVLILTSFLLLALGWWLWKGKSRNKKRHSEHIHLDLIMHEEQPDHRS